MNDNQPPKKGLMFTGEALIRLPDEKLLFIGMPSDPRQAAVDAINAGHYGQAEIDALDGLPVFDELDLDPEGDTVLWIVPQIGRCKAHL